jgi:hypothetical protein
MISVDVAQDRLCTMSRLERRLQSNILSQVHDFVAANYYGGLLYGRFRGLRCVAQNLSQAKLFHAES